MGKKRTIFIFYHLEKATAFSRSRQQHTVQFAHKIIQQELELGWLQLQRLRFLSSKQHRLLQV